MRLFQPIIWLMQLFACSLLTKKNDKMFAVQQWLTRLQANPMNILGRFNLIGYLEHVTFYRRTISLVNIYLMFILKHLTSLDIQLICFFKRMDQNLRPRFRVRKILFYSLIETNVVTGDKALCSRWLLLFDKDRKKNHFSGRRRLKGDNKKLQYINNIPTSRTQISSIQTSSSTSTSICVCVCVGKY